MESKFNLTILLLVTLMLYGCGYENYEECVLSEMKGQNSSMQSTAEKVCERKFPYEKELFSFIDGSYDFTWSKNYFGGITIEVKNNETEYQITRAIMKFSEKTCDKSQHKDFDTEVLFEFESGKSATAYSSKVDDLLCMKTDSVYGIIN
ncbi:hypothetical protein [Kangiella sp.]|uniref:hypothetical protein n=1 Tax=Kangiella sp. TaxID=1920245 RepID=UPI0019929348|nr:hypothetical protein [Kangiella sp.]MBD3653613.1 hypothetical protein [Kangiella sp.]